MKKNKFKINSKDKTGFISLNCGECSGIFGVKSQFMDMVGEANFRYVCPYCQSIGTVKD